MTAKKIILLNGGTRTRAAFSAGCGALPFEPYRTKEIIAYVSGTSEPEFYYRNERVDFSDATIFTRLRATDQHFCGILYYYFNQRNIPATDPINSYFQYSEEKIAQMVMLSMNGIRVPTTLIARRESLVANRAIAERLITFPAVFKTNGSQGKNVHLVHDLAELDTCIVATKNAELFIIQPFVENTFDIRILVYKDTILGAIKRTRRSSFKNNVANGAHVERYELSAEEIALAKRACTVCGIDFGGVDLVHTPEGPLLFEVNKSPQVRGFESVHDFSVFERIAQLVTSEYLPSK